MKGTLDFGLLYSPSKVFKLVGYSNSDQVGDTDDRKSDSGFVFYMGDIAFVWPSKKQPIVTVCCYYLQCLSCNLAEYFVEGVANVASQSDEDICGRQVNTSSCKEPSLS